MLYTKTGVVELGKSIFHSFHDIITIMNPALLEILLTIIGALLHQYMNVPIELVVSIILSILGVFSLITGKAIFALQDVNGWKGRLIGIFMIVLVIYYNFL